MDQFVDFECVDLPSVHSHKPVPHSLEQQPQLLLVISTNQLTRDASLLTLTGPIGLVRH